MHRHGIEQHRCVLSTPERVTDRERADVEGSREGERSGRRHDVETVGEAKVELPNIEQGCDTKDL